MGTLRLIWGDIGTSLSAFKAFGAEVSWPALGAAAGLRRRRAKRRSPDVAKGSENFVQFHWSVCALARFTPAGD